MLSFIDGNGDRGSWRCEWEIKRLCSFCPLMNFRCLVSRLYKLIREGVCQCLTLEKFRIYIVGENAKRYDGKKGKLVLNYLNHLI